MCNIINLRGFSHDQIGSSAQITGEKWSKIARPASSRAPQGARPGRVSRYSFEASGRGGAHLESNRSDLIRKAVRAPFGRHGVS